MLSTNLTFSDVRAQNGAVNNAQKSDEDTALEGGARTLYSPCKVLVCQFTWALLFAPFRVKWCCEQ